jgi:hypothetical protein
MSWAVLSIELSLCYIIAVTIYRLFFHPLAGFPGPKLAAITYLYESYFDIVQGGQYTFKIRELHRKYGKDVWRSCNYFSLEPSTLSSYYDNVNHLSPRTCLEIESK